MPAIEMSSGACRPSALSARIAPIVAMLLPAASAVGGRGRAISAWVEAVAAAVVALPVTSRAGSNGKPCVASADL